MDGSIASAVMLPENDVDSPQSPASPPGGHKRRQPSTSEQDSKRQRLNSIDSNAHLDDQDTVIAKPSNPPVTGRRERGRERRLFGAALGALSLNPTSSAQKRRSEIEKRQRAQREAQEQENDARNLERLSQRRAQRQKEQALFEKESMRLRHENLLHMAHFLRTRTEPHLYYKPWETTADEERRIQDQIREAEETIRLELGESKLGEQQEEGASEQRRVSRNGDAGPDADANPLNGKDLGASTPQHSRQDTTNESINLNEPNPKDPEQREDHAESFASEAVSGKQVAVDQQADPISGEEALIDEASKDLMDENGEEVVEAAEDTVIY